MVYDLDLLRIEDNPHIALRARNAVVIQAAELDGIVTFGFGFAQRLLYLHFGIVVASWQVDCFWIAHVQMSCQRTPAGRTKKLLHCILEALVTAEGEGLEDLLERRLFRCAISVGNALVG